MPLRTPSSPPAAPPTFVAIDFETADYGRDSACALALVRVEAGVIVQRTFSYIRAALAHDLHLRTRPASGTSSSARWLIISYKSLVAPKTFAPRLIGG